MSILDGKFIKAGTLPASALTDFNNPHNVIAADVSYQNGTSGLVATNVQDALDELDNKIDVATGTSGVAYVQSFDTNVFNDYTLLFENTVDTGYQFKTLELELTSAQLLSLGTSPIEILPINTDKFIVPIKGIFTTIGRNFYSNQTLELIFEGDSSGSYIFKNGLSAGRPGKRRMTFMYENQDNPGIYADAALLLRAKDGIDPVGRGHGGILKLLYALVD